MESKWRSRAKIVACVELVLSVIGLVLTLALIGLLICYFTLKPRYNHDGQHNSSELNSEGEDPVLWLDPDAKTALDMIGPDDFSDPAAQLAIFVLVIVLLVALAFGALLLVAAVKLLQSTNLDIPLTVALWKATFWRNVKIVSIVIQVIHVALLVVRLQWEFSVLWILVDLAFLYIVSQYLAELREAINSGHVSLRTIV